jgi:hypothetical protein
MVDEGFPEKRWKSYSPWTGSGGPSLHCSGLGTSVQTLTPWVDTGPGGKTSTARTGNGQVLRLAFGTMDACGPGVHCPKI